MAFPTTGILDDFNRTNEDPLATASSGHTWSNRIAGGTSMRLQVSSNQCLADTAGDYNSQYISDTDFGPDVEVYFTMPTIASVTPRMIAAAYARLTNEGSTSCQGYEVEVDHYISGGEILVYRMDSSSSFTQLGSAFARPGGGQIQAGDSVGMKVTGTGATVTIEVFCKPSGGAWTSLGTVTDTSGSRKTTAGKVGLEIYTNTPRVDDFGGGTVVVGTTYTKGGGAVAGAVGAGARYGAVPVTLAAKLIEINPGTAGTDQAYTGLGFRPKALIFFTNNRTSAGTSSSGSQNVDMPMTVLGISDGTTDAVLSTLDDYTAGNPIYTADRCIFTRTPGDSTDRLSADTVSLDADGFTLHWYVAQYAADISVLALGGTDLTNAKVYTWTGPTSGGSTARTGVGFKPDAMLMVAGTSLTAQGGVGFASGPSARGTIASSYNSGIMRYQRSDRIIAATGGTNEIRFQADLTSFDSDGFTLNWDAAESLSTTFCAALCLKGAQFKVGALTEKTSNGSQGYTGVGFRPKALMFLSTGKTAGTSIDTSLVSFMTGAATGASERAAVELADNATGVARRSITAAITHTNGSGATVGEADLTSFDSDGFTLDWTSTDGTARETLYLAFGDAAAAGSTYTKAGIGVVGRI